MYWKFPLQCNIYIFTHIFKTNIGYSAQISCLPSWFRISLKPAPFFWWNRDPITVWFLFSTRCHRAFQIASRPPAIELSFSHNDASVLVVEARQSVILAVVRVNKLRISHGYMIGPLEGMNACILSIEPRYCVYYCL